MKKLISLIILLTCAVLQIVAQKPGSINSGEITSGFYLKFGGSIPVQSFKDGKFIPDYIPGPKDGSFVFLPAKAGPVMDLGFLIYTGPAFAKKFVRVGIDATFLSSSVHFTNKDLDEDQKSYEYWYYFMGQKFGPVVTVNPVDKLMLDFSYKLCTDVTYYNDQFGVGLWMQEMSFNIRYRVMTTGIQYHFGKIDYNDLDDTEPEKIADLTTIRILFGLKF